MRSNTPSLVRSQGGFTIVESLIVIAISGMLLASAVLLVAGQQRKVEFSQAAQDIRSVVEQLVAETSAGHYPNSGSFSCSANPSTVNFVTGSTTQGANNRCIFLGRAIQFGNGGNRESYVVHTIAGYQDNNGSLPDAIPTAIPAVATFDGTRTFGNLHNGLNVVGMRYVSGGTPSGPISAVAFLQSLGEVDTNNNLLSGSQQVMLVPIPASGSVSTSSVTNTVNAVGSQLRASPPINPDGGVQICLASGGTNMWALITIGSNGRNLSVTLDYKGAVCW